MASEGDSHKLAEAMVTEHRAIASRRERLGMIGESDGIWALAISGGGIRSATLGLGVMEALATVDVPGVSADARAGNGHSRGLASLLTRMDYLSTVSGGGYIGAFFCSLFVPGRLRGESTDPQDARPEQYAQAARDAYCTMATIPPGRLRTEDVFHANEIGKRPKAWLRENGRYLAPGGAGDYLYMVASGLRNWAAVHYVIGTLFLCLFSLLSFGRGLVTKVITGSLGRISWKPSLLWPLAALVTAAWIIPSGIAFWLSYPGQGRTDSARPAAFGVPAVCALLLGLLLVASGSAVLQFLVMQTPWTHSLDADGASDVAVAAITIGIMVILGFLFHLFHSAKAGSITALRVALTSTTARAIGWLCVIVVAAGAETLGHSIYGYLLKGDYRVPAVPALAGLVWGVRTLAKFFDERKIGTLASRVPLGVAATVIGSLILILVASLWEVLVLALSWLGQDPSVTHPGQSWWHVVASGIVFALSFVLAYTVGLFPGFINLSALQSVYGARLTRAYLGASNGLRFRPHVERAWLSPAHPQEGDQLSLRRYYDPKSYAPLHIINVTVNQTVDPSDQLVQRDRKGQPLAVLPTGFSVDGAFFERQENAGESKPKELREGRVAQPLSVGEWIGTSGAAISTGLGRATTFGTSLALGLANMRLGVWWSSGQGQDDSGWLQRMFKGVFRTQMFLLYELSGRFYGLHREWQYLSDGGHFENIGLYELLRPQRQVRFIVACDNGCDPEYRFEDLANLIRLVRIDFSSEVEVDGAIVQDPVLGRVFGIPEDFRPSAPASDKCALLLNVFREEEGAGRRHAARIILIKPRVIRDASVDIAQYHLEHPDFPQQSTVEQFFNEAQWESYRDLGFRIGRRIFAPEADGGVMNRLWSYIHS